MANDDADAEKEVWQKTAADNGVVLGFVDLNDNDDMMELYGMLGVKGVAVKSRLRAFISEKQRQLQQPAFLVEAVVRGAKQSNGTRGNVFKILERHLGHYSEQEGIQILYEQEDLHVKAYFLSYDAACQLQNALNEWEIHKELANLKGVTLDPLTPAQIPRPPDLNRIYLQDYKPQETESPCQTLDQLHSYHLSVPATEAVEPDTPLLRFQSIDKLVPHLKHYKCHLKDKANFRRLQNNENNMLAASWTFHHRRDSSSSHIYQESFQLPDRNVR